MSEELTIKYFAENEFCREPYQASEDGAGYDLYAARTSTLFPKKLVAFHKLLDLQFQKVIMERFFHVLVFWMIIL